MFFVFFDWNASKFCDTQTSEPPLREPTENWNIIIANRTRRKFLQLTDLTLVTTSGMTEGT